MHFLQFRGSKKGELSCLPDTQSAQAFDSLDSQIKVILFTSTWWSTFTNKVDNAVMLQSLLRRLGYTREISHGVLMAMVEHRCDLESKTKPILDTLRSYQDLPPVILTTYLLRDHFLSYRCCCKVSTFCLYGTWITINNEALKVWLLRICNILATHYCASVRSENMLGEQQATL